MSDILTQVKKLEETHAVRLVAIPDAEILSRTVSQVRGQVMVISTNEGNEEIRLKEFNQALDVLLVEHQMTVIADLHTEVFDHVVQIRASVVFIPRSQRGKIEG